MLEPEPVKRKKPQFPGEERIPVTYATRKVQEKGVGLREISLSELNIREPGTANAVKGRIDAEKAQAEPEGVRLPTPEELNAQAEPEGVRLPTPEELNKVPTTLGEIENRIRISPEQQARVATDLDRLGKETPFDKLTPEVLLESSIEAIKKLDRENKEWADLSLDPPKPSKKKKNE